MEGRWALAEIQRAEGAGLGAEPKLRFESLDLSMYQTSKGRKTSNSLQDCTKALPSRFWMRACAQPPTGPDRSSRATRARARASATPTGRSDARRRAGTDVAPAQGRSAAAAAATFTSSRRDAPADSLGIWLAGRCGGGTGREDARGRDGRKCL